MKPYPLPLASGEVHGAAGTARSLDACMRGGDFPAAWTISDAVLQARAGTPCWHWPRHQQYIWNGRPLHGQRVLLRCYHGLGDTVQFIRYAPLVRAMAREVIVWAQPALLPLLRGMRGVDRWLPLHDGTPEVEYDTDVELMELPHVFRTTLATIPGAVPYLHVGPAALERSPGRREIGLVWSAGDWDEGRSLRRHQLEPLLRLTGIRWHVLQRGRALSEWPAGIGVISGSDDAVQAAVVMRSLDLVISVDSFPAHLAGALGVPTWVLLRAEADWRWLRDRSDSPWYPTMRLFRERETGNWTEVVARVAAELVSESGAMTLAADSARCVAPALPDSAAYPAAPCPF